MKMTGETLCVDLGLITKWTYCAMDGEPLGMVGRYENGTDKKDIVPFFKGSQDTWKVGITLTPRPLYGQEKLTKHDKNKAVFVVEGEKAAFAMQGLGCTALTSLGGSNAAKQSDWSVLSGFKIVYLLPDNDGAGEHYIKDVYQEISQLQVPPTINILRFSELEEAGDIVDWIQELTNDWDGYALIDKSLHKSIRESLKEKLDDAEPVPEDWKLEGGAGKGEPCFNNLIPNEIKTKIPAIKAVTCFNKKFIFTSSFNKTVSEICFK